MTHAEIYQYAKYLERLAHRIVIRHRASKGDRRPLDPYDVPAKSTRDRDKNDLEELDNVLWKLHQQL